MATDTIAYTGTLSKQEIRHARGCALCRERSADIWQVAPHTYRVPSASDENTVYIVCTRKGFEFCPCTDFREWCAEQDILCKHIHAANNWRLKSEECADCKVRLLVWHLHLVGEDHLTFYEDDYLCGECASKAGVR